MCASSSKATKKWAGRESRHYVASKPADLKADFALVSDTELFAPGLPTLCVGLRGMIYTELEVRGAKTDLHSGMYGGAAPNPFVSLAQILAKLKDENGHILIPGFYDDIIPPSPEELAAWHSLPFDEEQYRIDRGGLEATGGRGRLQRAGAHLGAAHAGRARHARRLYRRRRQDRDSRQGLAKVSMRLVPGHDAGQILRALQELCGEDRPRRRGCRGAADSLRRPLPDSASTIRTSRPLRAPCTRSGARTRSSSAPAAPSPLSATLTATWACPA